MKSFRLLAAFFVLGFFFGGFCTAKADFAEAGIPVSFGTSYVSDIDDHLPVMEEDTVSRLRPNVAKYGMTRGEIKSLPILERPSRRGHFYGNAVRRRAGVE